METIGAKSISSTAASFAARSPRHQGERSRESGAREQGGEQPPRRARGGLSELGRGGVKAREQNETLRLQPPDYGNTI